MTPKLLAEILSCPIERAEKWAEPLGAAMDEFEINTPERQAAFIAQIGHESGRLVYVREIWSPQQVPAQETYEGRKDLGNTEPGDGYRYRGRGLIQITGRANYGLCGKGLGIDCVAHPELLEEPVNSARSAAWFWRGHGCNALADAEDFRAITRKINGGFNGLERREMFYASAKRALGIDDQAAA